MSRLNFYKVIGALVFSLSLLACMFQLPARDVWKLGSLEQVAGFPIQVEGNPEIVDSPLGPVTRFDGDGDRVLVENNPLVSADEFTIELLVKPDDAYPNNWEPRIFHIEAPHNPNRRLTIEMRLNDQHQWYLDAYIKAERQQRVLIDPALVHPVGQWAHIAVTYAQSQFTSYVNGQRELSGEVTYLPIGPKGRTSIGARMNLVNWFKGEVGLIAITRSQLQPEQFQLLEQLPK